MPNPIKSRQQYSVTSANSAKDSPVPDYNSCLNRSRASYGQNHWASFCTNPEQFNRLHRELRAWGRSRGDYLLLPHSKQQPSHTKQSENQSIGSHFISFWWCTNCCDIQSNTCAPVVSDPLNLQMAKFSRYPRNI